MPAGALMPVKSKQCWRSPGRSLGWAAATILIALPLWARGRLDGWVEQGNQTVVSSLVGTTVKAQRSYPAALVTVLNTITQTPATIYSDSAGTLKANPFSADSNGYWFFWAEDGSYDVQFSGAGFTTFTRPSLRIISTSNSAIGMVDVSTKATGGTGTRADPYTGWDTAISWDGVPGAGTITATNNTNQINGVGTTFTTQAAVGQYITVGNLTGQILTVNSDTLITLTGVWAYATQAGVGYKIASPAAYNFTCGIDGLHGYYNLAASPAWSQSFTKFRGCGGGGNGAAGNTILTFTGAGNGFVIDGGDGVLATRGGQTANNVSIEHLSIVGNAATTNCLFLRGTYQPILNDVSMRNCTTGMNMTFAVAPTVTNIRYVSGNMDSLIATTGISLNKRKSSSAEDVITGTFVRLFVASVAGPGIVCGGCYHNTFIDLVSEGNTGASGRGMDMLYDSNTLYRSSFNTLINPHFEGNTASNRDLTINGNQNTVINISAASNVAVGDSAMTGGVGVPSGNNFYGGIVNGTLVVDNSNSGASLRNAFRDIQLAGAITDNGIGTGFSNTIGTGGHLMPFVVSGPVRPYQDTTPSVAPTSGAGGGATGGSDAGNTDSFGVGSITAGAGAGSSGTITVTFATANPSAHVPVCSATLNNQVGSAWNSRATIMVAGATPSTCVFAWDNNSVALGNGSTYGFNWVVAFK